MSARTTRSVRRASTSTCARRRSMAGRSRSSATSSPRPCWVCKGKQMDFSYTEEQTLLRNSVSKYLADNYKYDARHKYTHTEANRDPNHWKQFAELGLLAAALPEEHGGLGGGVVESSIIMEEFGKTLVIEPYVPTVVIGGGFLKHGGSDAQKEEWLAKIGAGESILAFAFAEPKGRYNLADLATTAKKQGGNYVLNGQKAVVVGAPWADRLLVRG